MALASRSSKHYKPGDVIQRIIEPLVHVTKYEHRMFTCDHCLKSTFNSSVVCPKCLKVYYCSNYCQTNGWKRLHRLECPILAQQKPMEFENQGIDYMQRLTLRLYLLLSTTDDESTEAGSSSMDLIINEDINTKPFILEHNGQIRTIEQMESHCEQLKDSDYFQGIRNYFRFYRIPDLDEQLLLRCYGLLHVNAFGIDCYDTENHCIEHRGTGLYVEASVFDHSCVPNACASGDGLWLEIRALSPIRPGDQIYIDYVQDVQPKMERIRILEERYFFTCACEFGCHPNLERPFDHEVDFKRLKILTNLIDTIDKSLIEQNLQGKNGAGDWSATKKCLELRLQRLKIQEEYYRQAQHHPCLSLFYQTVLRFVILNHENLAPHLKPNQIHQLMAKAKQHLIITHGRDHPFSQWTISLN